MSQKWLVWYYPYIITYISITLYYLYKSKSIPSLLLEHVPGTVSAHNALKFECIILGKHCSHIESLAASNSTWIQTQILHNFHEKDRILRKTVENDMFDAPDIVSPEVMRSLCVQQYRESSAHEMTA